MYVFIVSLICGIMLGGVYFAVYENPLEAVVVGFLLFTAIDTGLRAIMDKPSWMLNLPKRKKK
jgi:ABC-type glucose/galactose transport system permease subunit